MSADQRVRPDRVRQGGQAYVAAILVLLLALAAGQIILDQKRLRLLSGQIKAQSNSVRVAQTHDELAREAAELQQELVFRNMGSIPFEQEFVIPPGAPPAVRPVPQVTDSALPEADRIQAVAVVRTLGHDPRRRSVQIRYAQQDVRRSGVTGSLSQMGFRILEPGRVTTNPTNGITFGDSVPLHDVRSVTYAMVAGGIGVKRVRRSAEATDPYVITLTHVSYATQWPPLTSAQIDQLVPGR